MTDDALAAFQEARPRLFGIAYRMLGTVAEAEDVVQDAWLRWQGVDHRTIREPAAFLATTVTRLAINAYESARARREVYVGPWLPEPVSTADDPTVGAERAEAISLAVLLLLERLTPAQRAAYVLREAFEYPFSRIAEILEVSETNARQLASRARAHLGRERSAPVAPADRLRLLEAFLAAAQHGDLASLESLLAEDAMSLSDGGGVVGAALRPVLGAPRVARFVLGLMEKYGDGLEPVVVTANGEPAVLAMLDGEPLVFCSLDASAAGVTRVLLVRNPEKLRAIAATVSRS